MENLPGQAPDSGRLASVEQRTRTLETRADTTDQRLQAIEALLKIAPVPAPVPDQPAPAPIPDQPAPQPAPEPVPDQPAPQPVPTPIPDRPAPQPAPEPVPDQPAPQPVPTPVPDQPAPQPVPTPVPDRPAPQPVPEPVPQKPAPQPAPPAIDFGKVTDFLMKYGLAVIGSLLLVSTVVWGMSYVYQYIGPELKLAAGGAVAAALIVFGERKSRDNRVAWWSQALIGTGYAIAYFVGYAAHNVASLKVIADPVTDSVLLLALAFLGGFHAMWRKSEPIALLSVLLAFFTISMSPVTYFSVVASGLMLTGLVFAIARMRWYGVYVVGSVASYATFMLFTQGQVMASSATAMAGLTLSAAFLFTYWLAFNAVAFLLKPADGARRTVVLATVIGNALAFLVPTMYQLGNQFPELRWAFLAIIGALYLASAALSALRKDDVLGRVMLVLGLQLVTAAVPLKLDGNAVTAVWLLETVALTVLGIRFAMPTLRAFGLVVAIACGIHMGVVDMQSTATFDLSGFAVPSRTLIGLVALLSSVVCYALYARSKFEKAIWEVEGLPAKAFYLAAVALGWLLPFLDAPVGVLPLIWAAQYAVLVLASKVFKGHDLQKSALLFFASAGIASVVYQPMMALPAVLAICALPFLVGVVYRFNLVSGEAAESAGLRQVYFGGGTVLMFVHTCIHFGATTGLILPLTGEAFALLALGMLLRDGVLRQLAGLGFGVTLAAMWVIGGVSLSTTLCVVGALSVAALAYRVFAMKSYTVDGWLPNERAVMRRLYPAAATVLLGLTVLNPVTVAPSLAPMILSAMAVALVLAGVYSRDQVLRLLGVAALATTVGFLATHVALWAWTPNLLAVTALVASGLVYRMRALQSDSDGIDVFGWAPANEQALLGQLCTTAASVLLGLTMVNLLSSAKAALALSVEAFTLVLLGSRFRDTVVRLLGSAAFAGAALCLVSNVALWSWGVTLPVVVLLLLAAFLYEVYAAQPDVGTGVPFWLTELEHRFVPQVYPVVAWLVLGASFLQLLSPAVAPLALALQVAFLALWGLKFYDSLTRVIAAAGVVVLGLFMYNHMDSWSWVVNVPVVGLLACVAAAYRRPLIDEDVNGYDGLSRSEYPVMKQAYGLLAALLMAVTSFQLLTTGGLPFAWAVEAIVLIAIGMFYREVPLKAAGLLLFFTLLGKFLLVDLRGVNDGLRIISWFGASVLALAGSWASFRFDPSNKARKELKEQAPPEAK